MRHLSVLQGRVSGISAVAAAMCLPICGRGQVGTDGLQEDVRLITALTRRRTRPTAERTDEHVQVRSCVAVSHVGQSGCGGCFGRLVCRDAANVMRRGGH
jgi:hypothetical protein